MRESFTFVVLLAFLLIVTSTAFAQNAQITGAVKDQSGGVMPGVTVTAKNRATGLTRTEVTDTGGNYRLVALPPGDYTLAAEIQGFTTQTFPSVVLVIDQTATLDFTLKPATVSESVTVTGEAPVVDVTRSDVATALSTQQIQDLPVAARRWMDMALLTPGTSQDNIRGLTYRGNVSIGAGVTTFYSTGVNVDGVNNTWAQMGEPRQNFPMDGIQEFNVSTSTYKAEYGLATGGIVNVVTKSGSNALHFSAFEFYRNQTLTEKQAFQTTNPPYFRSQAGGTIGGPIVKDRLHYFFTVERTDEDIYNTVNTGGVWPQHDGTYKSAQLGWTYLVRADHQISNNQSVFFRFAKEYGYKPALTTGGSTTPSASLDFGVPRTSAVLGHTFLMGRRSLNDFRFQYAYSKYAAAPPYSGGDWPAGYFGPDRLSLCTEMYRYPSVSVGGCGQSQMGPEYRFQVKNTYSYQSSASRHQWKMGFDFSHLPFEADNVGNRLGIFTFPLDRLYDPNDPRTWPTQYTQSLPTYAELPTKTYALFVQDDWKPANDLTLSLGLRYDRQLGPFNENLEEGLALISETLGPEFARYPLPIPFIDQGIRGDATNFGPRIGLAWDPTSDGRTNIHAAFGVYYDNMRTLTNAGELTWPQSQTIIINNPNFADPLQGRSRSAFLSTAPPNITVVDNHLQNPMSRSFNVGVTRELTHDLGLTADFNFANRYDDGSTVDINLPDQTTGLKPHPQFGRVSQIQSVFDTTYRALLVKLDKRLSRRWSALVSYTLAFARDLPVSSDQGSSYGFVRNDGYSLADRRHVVRASGTVQLPWEMQVSAILDLRTRQPFNPATSLDINRDGYTGDLPPGVGFRSGCRDMDLNAVSAFRATRALAAVTSVACPSYQDIDVRLSKLISLKNYRLELIGQLFNVMNHANFATPISNPLSPSFGTVNQIVPFINAPSRQAELAIRLRF